MLKLEMAHLKHAAASPQLHQFPETIRIIYHIIIIYRILRIVVYCGGFSTSTELVNGKA